MALRIAVCHDMPKPVREYVFDSKRKFRFDFAFPEDLLWVEVQGGTRSGGAHVRGGRYEEDCVKACHASILGWRGLPVTSEMIYDGRAIKLIRMALHLEER